MKVLSFVLQIPAMLTHRCLPGNLGLSVSVLFQHVFVPKIVRKNPQNIDR